MSFLRVVKPAEVGRLAVDASIRSEPVVVDGHARRQSRLLAVTKHSPANVLSTSDVFQVAYGVIGAIAVNVVNLTFWPAVVSEVPG